jgi:hypothetical protein
VTTLRSLLSGAPDPHADALPDVEPYLPPVIFADGDRRCLKCGWKGTVGQTTGGFERCPECLEPTASPSGEVDGVRLVRALFQGGKP